MMTIRPKYLETVFIPIILGAATFILRLLIRSQTLYNNDSINFALAKNDFDIFQLRPHPPGFLLYVKTAQDINRFVNNPTDTLIALSMIFGVLAVLFVYTFAYKRFGVQDATISALLILTNPLVWFHDEWRTCHHNSRLGV
jgi:hypothetical protein